jgi:cytochrome c biogenesis protein CcmG/thiol:disulfide interchange protein DsbE
MKMPTRASRSVLTIAFTACLLLLGCRDAATETGKTAAPGAKASFQLRTLDGRKLGPKDFPGKVVVVDFWATWCGPCHVQARILEPIYEELKDKGVQFLAANVGEQPETVRAFLKDKPIPYPVLIDPDDVAGKLGVLALPTLMVIDKQGRITYFEAGLTDASTLRKALKQAGA